MKTKEILIASSIGGICYLFGRDGRGTRKGKFEFGLEVPVGHH